MDHFPVTNSTLSAAHLAAFVKDHYAFEGQVDCRLIRAGVNDTYLIVCKDGRFVFRVYTLGWRSEAEILAEIGLLNRLKRAAIPVSYPITDRRDGYLQQLNAPEGLRFGVLFSYAQGEKVISSPEATHSRIGRLMADFHSCTLDQTIDRVAYTAETLLVRPLAQLAGYLPADTEEMGMMKSMQTVLLGVLSGADATDIRQGTVHLDLWFDNINVADDGTATIFDFDFCGNGWLCLDIAYYMMQLYFVEPDEEQYQRKLDAFLAEYESVQALCRTERDLLPALGVSLYFFYLGVQCELFESYSSVFLSETYLKRYIVARVRKYFDFHRLG